MIHLELFFCILYTTHQTSFSSYGYLLAPLLFVEDYPSSTHFLCASSKISYHTHVVYFWTLCFDPVISLPILVPRWFCFHYYNFIISSKSGSATPPTWLFCFKVAWAILSHSHFRLNFTVKCSLLQKLLREPTLLPPPPHTPGLWEITRLKKDTPHLLLISQVALSFTVWCPVPWKHHFTYFAFFPFGCFRQKGKSSSCSPVFAISRLVVTILLSYRLTHSALYRKDIMSEITSAYSWYQKMYETQMKHHWLWIDNCL